jgi:3-methylcrotonyl-CoA carboxylase beta subunit
VPASEAFRANRAAHMALLGRVRDAAAQAASGGGDRARERHLARGKMVPRDRVGGLLDPGSPFLEIGATAAWGMYGKRKLKVLRFFPIRCQRLTATY